MEDVESYLSSLSVENKLALNEIRATVRHQIKNADETISYGIPTFKYKGKHLLAYAAFKNHLSIFPGAEPIEQLNDELSGFTLSRGTIQFSLDKKIPEQLLIKIIHLCKDRIEREQK